MKAALIIIGLLVLGFLGFSLLGGSEAQAPVEVDEVEVLDTMEEGQEQPEAVDESDVVPADAEVAAAAEDAAEAEPTTHEFTLDSFNFGYSETELRVGLGDTVTINLTSSDGFHDWVVDELTGAATDKIKTGEETSVTFVADQAGTFEYYCSVGAHRANGMVGTIVVE